MRFALASLLVLTGCWWKTVRTSETPSTPALTCLDCDQPTAVGIPIRLATSWAGTCTREGLSWNLHEDHDTGSIEWRRTSFSTTKTCHRKAYKIEVACSAKCTIHSAESPDAEQKLIAVFPEHAGPLHLDVKMRIAGSAEPAARIETDVLVREPDHVGRAMPRKYDDPSPRAAFAGFDYDLLPSDHHRDRPAARGTKYRPETGRGETFDRLDRRCFTRAPATTEWRSCVAGIRPGDDVRVDVQATFQGRPVLDDIALAADPGWYCYRAPALGIGQTCTRYAIPAGDHALVWSLGDISETDHFSVSAPVGEPAVAAHTDGVAVSFDSREAFDTRGTRGFALFGVETELVRWNGVTYPSASVLVEMPTRPQYGALRLGIGGFGSDGDEGPKTLRGILGWRYSIGCLAYRLCLNVAADAGYRYSEGDHGLFVLPHANLDLRGSGLVARIGAGPALLLGTQTTVGLVIKLTLGLGGNY